MIKQQQQQQLTGCKFEEARQHVTAPMAIGVVYL